MDFKTIGNKNLPTLMLIPGLGVSYEIFSTLMSLVKDKFFVIAVQIDGFTLEKVTKFTSVQEQAHQIVDYVQSNFIGHINCAYGLSLGGTILAHAIETNTIRVDHVVFDAAPMLPIRSWIATPLRHLQFVNVWLFYHFGKLLRQMGISHYYSVLLDECLKVYPFGGSQAILEGYKSVYASKLSSIYAEDVNYWFGSRESLLAKPQIKHLCELSNNINIEMFPRMSHGQLLIDCPETVMRRLLDIVPIASSDLG